MNSFYNERELKKLGFNAVGKNVVISKKTSFYSINNIEIMVNAFHL